MMKKNLLLVSALFIIPFLCYSQEKQCDINKQFAQNAQFFFNSFQEGTVVFNDDAKTDALLNYNIITDDIYYIEDNKYFSLNREDVKYVVICDYRFYFYKTNVLELIYSKNFQLLVERKVNQEELYDKKGAYGASSPNTVGVDLQYANIVPQPQSNMFIVNLRKEGDKELDLIYSYKIKNGNKFYPATKKTFYTLFSDKKNILKQYFKENQFDFDSKEDLIKISNYCHEL